jgi:fluoroquinolone transport system permease protein
VLVNAFYFVAGLVLLEKGEGTLEVQVITPLRRWEYLASKVLTLTILSLVESAAIAAVSVGTGCNWPLLLGGTALLCALLTLFGFAAVARYDSINEFILPSAGYTVALCAPMLAWFEAADSALFYLHPIHAPLLLLRAAFQPVAPWEMAYAALYGGLWIGLMMRVCLGVFYRFIIAGARAV